jgi:ribosomal RNA-processing protein 7
VREEKQQKLVDLRRRFEEDKAKVQAMKAARKFNPF